MGSGICAQLPRSSQGYCSKAWDLAFWRSVDIWTGLKLTSKNYRAQTALLRKSPWGLRQKYVLRDISLEWELYELPGQECWAEVGFLSYGFGSIVNVFEAFSEFPCTDVFIGRGPSKTYWECGKGDLVIYRTKTLYLYTAKTFPTISGVTWNWSHHTVIHMGKVSYQMFECVFHSENKEIAWVLVIWLGNIFYGINVFPECLLYTRHVHYLTRSSMGWS